MMAILVEASIRSALVAGMIGLVLATLRCPCSNAIIAVIGSFVVR
jgi:hypothetical protein